MIRTIGLLTYSLFVAMVSPSLARLATNLVTSLITLLPGDLYT